MRGNEFKRIGNRDSGDSDRWRAATLIGSLSEFVFQWLQNCGSCENES